MPLAVPLKYYDDLGHIKPPGLMWLGLWFVCRSYFVFVASLANRQDTTGLLSLFYPDKADLYLSLGIGLPALMAMLICSFRNKLRDKNQLYLFSLIKLLFSLSLLLDMLFHMYLSRQEHWLFSWVTGITLVVDLFWLLYVHRSRHLAAMIVDWRRVTE